MVARRAFSGGTWLDAPDLTGVLVAEGDSLTAGSGGGETPWPTLIASSLPSATIFNEALSGERVGADMLFDTGGQIDTHYNAAKPWNVAVLWGGINDLANGRTPAQLHGDIQTWCQSVNAGFLVIVCNIAWTTVLGSQTNIDDTNSLLSSSHAFCDTLVDVRTLLGTDGTNPSFWQADDLHLTTAGEQAVATAIYNAIVALVS